MLKECYCQEGVFVVLAMLVRARLMRDRLPRAGKGKRDAGISLDTPTPIDNFGYCAICRQLFCRKKGGKGILRSWNTVLRCRSPPRRLNCRLYAAYLRRMGIFCGQVWSGSAGSWDSSVQASWSVFLASIFESWRSADPPAFSLITIISISIIIICIIYSQINTIVGLYIYDQNIFFSLLDWL